MYQWTVSPQQAPDEGEEITLGFEKGVPVTNRMGAQSQQRFLDQAFS
jgi:argininosuccinate synthase